MDENIANRLMFITLDKIRKIGTPLVSMWAINNRYARPPFFRFRFKDTPYEDVIYKKLSEIIKGFNGNLEWEMIHDEKKSASYFVSPKPFSSFIFKDNFKYTKQRFLDFLPLADYESAIDKAILDIPDLTKYITEQYKERE